MYKVYQIEDGDNLDSIAIKTNTTIEELEELNGPLGNFFVGEYIVVPNNEMDDFKTYIVKKGDTLYSIAMENGMGVDYLALLNGLNKEDYIYPNQQLIMPTEENEIYITKVGDTIDTLIDNFGVDYMTISNQNSKIYLLPEQLIMIKKK